MKAGRWIFSVLKNNRPLARQVGSRIYPISIPQDAEYPAIVYMCDYEPADLNKQQVATADNVKLTLRIWATKYTDCETIDELVRDALDFNDAGGAGITAEGVTILVSEFAASKDGIDETLENYFREMNFNLREKL